MQSDTPQGDPRLQKPNRAPRIATGFVDPCLLYVEIYAEMVPTIVVCFAAASREVCGPDKNSRLELENTLVILCEPHRPLNFKGCHFRVYEETLLSLENGRLTGLPLLDPRSFKGLTRVFKQSLRYLDHRTATALQRRFDSARSPNFPLAEFALEIVKFGNLNWASLTQFVEIRPRANGAVHPSLVRRLFSVFKKKKSKPVAA